MTQQARSFNNSLPSGPIFVVGEEPQCDASASIRLGYPMRGEVCVCGKGALTRRIAIDREVKGLNAERIRLAIVPSVEHVHPTRRALVDLVVRLDERDFAGGEPYSYCV